MAEIRGNAFVAISEWLVKRLKEDGYQRFLSEMRPPVAQVLSQREVWSWYPLEYLSEVYESIQSILGNGNGKVLGELGEFVAVTDLGGAPKTKLGLLPLPRVIARFPYLWSRYKDCGEMEVVNIDEAGKKAELKLKDYGGDETHCNVTTAWLEKVSYLLSGVKVTAQETLCRWIKGGDACKWELSWD